MTNEELAAAIRSGRTDLYIGLWLQVERFISSQAGKYFERLDGRRGVTKEDLTQAGFLALVDAVQSYNPVKGSFVGWLSFYLHKHFREAAGLRTERQQADPINSAVSLDQPITEDGGRLEDLQADPHNAIEDTERRLQNEQLRAMLDTAISKLRPNDAEAVRLRYLRGLTMREAADVAGITQEALRQREASGLRELRRIARKHHLDLFIELKTDYYKPSAFQITHTSPVERIVLRREELRKEYAERLEARKRLCDKV